LTFDVQIESFYLSFESRSFLHWIPFVIRSKPRLALLIDHQNKFNHFCEQIFEKPPITPLPITTGIERHKSKNKGVCGKRFGVSDFDISGFPIRQSPKWFSHHLRNTFCDFILSSFRQFISSYCKLKFHDLHRLPLSGKCRASRGICAKKSHTLSVKVLKWCHHGYMMLLCPLRLKHKRPKFESKPKSLNKKSGRLIELRNFCTTFGTQEMEITVYQHRATMLKCCNNTRYYPWPMVLCPLFRVTLCSTRSNRVLMWLLRDCTKQQDQECGEGNTKHECLLKQTLLYLLFAMYYFALYLFVSFFHCSSLF